MQTALANKQGVFVIPVLVTGTFSNPTFAPDIQQIARMRVNGLVPNFNDPASITGTLQALLGRPRNFGLDSQPPENQQVQEPNPVRQLTELFGKKKKPTHEAPTTK